MLPALKASFSLILTAALEWVRDRCSGLAAALAYNLILAVAPFIGLILWLSDHLLGGQWTRSYILPAVFAWIGPRGEGMLRFFLMRSVDATPRQVFALGILGLLGLFFGSVGFFLQMQDALQTIWDVRREQTGLVVQLKKRALGLGYVLATSLITFAAIAASAAFFALGRPAAAHPLPLEIRWLGLLTIAFLAFWSVMAFWLKYLPPIHLPWRQVLPWAALTAAFHLCGRVIFDWVSRTDPSTSLAESLVLSLLWFYYASAVFLYGAELMRIHHQRRIDMLKVRELAPNPKSEPRMTNQ